MRLRWASPLLALTLALGFGLASAPVAPRASSPYPGCEAGPKTIGETTWGTPCADVILAPPAVERVEGGAGDDVILAAPIAASAPCPDGCYLGVGSQTFDGGPGDDLVFGQRGNDTLNGGEGDDRLFGGIGDDRLRGGPGGDLLSGGFGFDSIDGEPGDDYVRGDATIDEILNSGGGFDTLSYATGVTPGFTRDPGIAGFPGSGGERGVYVDLETGTGDNGVAPSGGGVDEINAAGFEKVVGTPFSDYIAGSGAAEIIEGGGGADALLGRDGDDTLRGGADGDYLDGGLGADTLDPGPGDAGNAIGLRDQTKVSTGFVALAEASRPQLYLSGSSGDDEVTATYSAAAGSVAFSLGAGSDGSFDESVAGGGGCTVIGPDEAECEVSAPPDSLVLAGAAGNDVLSAIGFPSSSSVVVLGGSGDDLLGGGTASEDVLVDGGGDDESTGLGGDDALLNNAGRDRLFGGEGNDLFLSNSICDDDLLDGGGGDNRDNSSWAKLGEPVEARLDSGVVGRPGGGAPNCAGGSLDHFQSIEDLEGTGQGDFFYGDSGNNQLLGRTGPDTYFALGGADTILANSGDEDLVIDCGAGVDSALIDRPPIVEPVPVGCESVNQAAPESFEPPPLAEEPATPPPATPPAVRPDRRPPVTRILHRPPATVLVGARRPRRVVFAFAANEPGASFRCGLDRAPFTPCRSPRPYRLSLGRHTFRVFAIDAAGNRDRSPALFAFQIRRR